jgi:TPR repeat protein
MAQLTSDVRAAADKGEQLIANAEQYSRVLAKSEQPAQRAEAPAKQMSPMREAVATLQPNTPPPLKKSSRYLDPQEVKVLITRGEQLMATGDVVAARGMFLRAAESEDPHAALVLGATYDPNVLVQLGVIGIAANLEKARGWYERAETWGSLEARRRLELLNR